MKNWLLSLVGLKKDYWNKLDDLNGEMAMEVMPALLHKARSLYRANITISIADFIVLSRIEQVALVKAGWEHKIRMCIRNGRSSQNEIENALIAFEIDGGEAHDDLVLERALLAASKVFSRGVK